MFATFWIGYSVAELIAVASQAISAGFAEVFAADWDVGTFAQGFTL